MTIGFQLPKWLDYALGFAAELVGYKTIVVAINGSFAAYLIVPHTFTAPDIRWACANNSVLARKIGGRHINKVVILPGSLACIWVGPMPTPVNEGDLG